MSLVEERLLGHSGSGCRLDLEHAGSVASDFDQPKFVQSLDDLIRRSSTREAERLRGSEVDHSLELVRSGRTGSVKVNVDPLPT